jgi:hypothetical protein
MTGTLNKLWAADRRFIRLADRQRPQVLKAVHRQELNRDAILAMRPA